MLKKCFCPLWLGDGETPSTTRTPGNIWRGKTKPSARKQQNIWKSQQKSSERETTLNPFVPIKHLEIHFATQRSNRCIASHHLLPSCLHPTETPTSSPALAKQQHQSGDPTGDCRTHSTGKDCSASRRVTFYRQTCLYRYSCPAQTASPCVERRNVQLHKVLVFSGKSFSLIRVVVACFCWLQGGARAFH